MTMKRMICIVLGCLLAAQASANEGEVSTADQTVKAEVHVSSVAVNQAEIDEQNKLSDASTKDITPKTLDDFFDEFANQFGIDYGVENKGKVFFTGSATVALPATDPSFAKAVNLAYDNAMLNMQADFVRDAFGRQSTVMLQKFFQDDSTNAREFEKLPPEGRFAQLLGKTINLVGAKLDSALAEMGVVVPEGLTQERKKVLFADSFVQKISAAAFGNMQGLIPVQSSMTKVEGSDQYYSIGVIAVMSDKTKQVANDMRQKRASLVTGKGRAVRDVLPTDNEGFINEHGIRLIYNESGAPMIMSYGQWSFQPASDAYMNNRKKEAAMEQATARADSAVAAFINTSLEFKRVAENSLEIENSLTETVNRDNTTVTEKTAKEIIDITTKEVSARSSMQLRGLRTLKRWTARDENGVEYVGVVRFYTHENVENTNKMIAPPTASKASAVPAAAKSTQDVTRKSRVVNDLDDF